MVMVGYRGVIRTYTLSRSRYLAASYVAILFLLVPFQMVFCGMDMVHQ